MGNAMSDGDKVEAIAPSHLSPMDFSGNCSHPRADACHWPIMQIVEHSLPTSHDGFCPFLLERLAMWPRGHISNRMRSASFGLRLLRQCERPCCTLAVVGGCTALFMVGAILAYDPARGFLARRGEPGGGT